MRQRLEKLLAFSSKRGRIVLSARAQKPGLPYKRPIPWHLARGPVLARVRRPSELRQVEPEYQYVFRAITYLKTLPEVDSANVNAARRFTP
jgi:hypothetical protein